MEANETMEDTEEEEEEAMSEDEEVNGFLKEVQIFKTIQSKWDFRPKK